MISGSLLSEDRITASEAARLLGVSPATCWRFATRGCGGVRLETFKIGRRTYSTRQAIERFIARQNGGIKHDAQPSDAGDREARLAAAERFVAS